MPLPTLMFLFEIQLDKENNLWVLTNTLPRFIYGKLDTNEYNFRIWRTNVFDAIRGTVCDWKHDHGHGHGYGFDNRWNDHDEHNHDHGYGYHGDHEWDGDHQMTWERSGNWKGGYRGGRNGYRQQ